VTLQCAEYVIFCPHFLRLTGVAYTPLIPGGNDNGDTLYEQSALFCYCMLVTIWMRGICLRFCCKNVLDGWKNCCIVTFLYLVCGQSFFLFNGKCIKRAVYILRGMWCCSWSRHCAMSWKFVDFIPSGVGILRWQSLQPHYEPWGQLSN